MSHPSEGGAVQVHLATSKDDKKKGSAPAPTAAASTTCFWVLFALGWILAPCWFVAVALGLRKGHDHECLITRKKGMSDASKWAWRGSLAMSILSILAVILVPAIVYGISAGPAQQAYYLTLAGPAATYPELNDSQLSLLAQALHGGLSLPASYPYTWISVWLDSTTTINPTSTTAARRLLQTDAAVNETMQVSVLGYSMIDSTDLPSEAELADRVENGTAVDDFSSQLVAVGLVPVGNAGRLSAGLLSLRANTREKLAALLEGKDGNPAFSLVPVGKRCKGNWTEWSECIGCGNQTRTFIIPPREDDDTTTTNNNNTDTNNTTDAEPTTRRHLLKSAADVKANSHGNGNGGGAGGVRPGQQQAGGQSDNAAAGPDVAGADTAAGDDARPAPSTASGRPHGRPAAAGNSGFAHALGHAQGLALALGRVECAVVNGTIESRVCTETCQT